MTYECGKLSKACWNLVLPASSKGMVVMKQVMVIMKQVMVVMKQVMVVMKQVMVVRKQVGRWGFGPKIRPSFSLTEEADPFGMVEPFEATIDHLF